MIELRGITWDQPRGLAPMQATARLFEQEHQGVHIEWTTRTLAAFGEQSIEQLAEHYDLLIIDHPFVGVAAESGCLVPLDECFPATFLLAQAQQSVGPSYESYTYAGHQWALAIDAAAQVSAYRPDLLRASDQAMPETWSDVIHFAQDMSIAIPLASSGAIDSFLTLCANYGEPAGSNTNYLVSRPTAHIAFDILQCLVSVAHPASLASNPPQVLDRMSYTDEIAYCPLLFGYSNYARASNDRHLCAFTNIPHSEQGTGPYGALLGGAGLAISSRCHEVTTACEYAQWVASPDCQRGIYISSGGQPGNRLAWTDPAVNAATNNFFLDTLETLDHAYVRPRYSGFVPFHDEASLLLHDYLCNGGKEEAVLDQIDLLYNRYR